MRLNIAQNDFHKHVDCAPWDTVTLHLNLFLQLNAEHKVTTVRNEAGNYFIGGGQSTLTLI